MTVEGNILRNNVRMLATAAPAKRQLATHELTKNLFLFTDDGRKVEKDPSTLRYEIDFLSRVLGFFAP